MLRYDMVLRIMVPRLPVTEIDSHQKAPPLVSRYEIPAEMCLAQLRLPVRLPRTVYKGHLPRYHLLLRSVTRTSGSRSYANPHFVGLETRKPGYLVESFIGHCSCWSSLPLCCLCASCAGVWCSQSPWPSSLGFSSNYSLLVPSRSTSEPHLVLRCSTHPLVRPGV